MDKKIISLVLSTFLMLGAMAGCSAGSSTVSTQSQVSQVSEQSSKQESSIIESSVESSLKEESSQQESDTLSILHGELLSANISDVDGKILVIKAKIKSSYSNKATVDQNYYNVADIIRNQNGNIYDSIDYWAVADMTDGDEAKVISFTVDKKTIQKVYNYQIADNQLGDYVTDLWIHQSLK